MPLESYLLVSSTGTNLIQQETSAPDQIGPAKYLSFDHLKVSTVLSGTLEVSQISRLHTWADKPILISPAPLFPHRSLWKEKTSKSAKSFSYSVG